MRGHFSFNLIGYAAYLKNHMHSSAKKLEADLDKEPFSLPPTPFASLQALVEGPAPQMEARNGNGRGRKRSLMTFSEVTDAFTEAAVENATDAWALAKARKVAGDDTLRDHTKHGHSWLLLPDSVPEDALRQISKWYN